MGHTPLLIAAEFLDCSEWKHKFLPDLWPKKLLFQIELSLEVNEQVK